MDRAGLVALLYLVNCLLKGYGKKVSKCRDCGADKGHVKPD